MSSFIGWPLSFPNQISPLSMLCQKKAFVSTVLAFARLLGFINNFSQQLISDYMFVVIFYVEQFPVSAMGSVSLARREIITVRSQSYVLRLLKF
jgi:hypothetical protein